MYNGYSDKRGWRIEGGAGAHYNSKAVSLMTKQLLQILVSETLSLHLEEKKSKKGEVFNSNSYIKDDNI